MTLPSLWRPLLYILATIRIAHCLMWVTSASALLAFVDRTPTVVHCWKGDCSRDGCRPWTICDIRDKQDGLSPEQCHAAFSVSPRPMSGWPSWSRRGSHQPCLGPPWRLHSKWSSRHWLCHFSLPRSPCIASAGPPRSSIIHLSPCSSIDLALQQGSHHHLYPWICATVLQAIAPLSRGHLPSWHRGRWHQLCDPCMHQSSNRYIRWRHSHLTSHTRALSSGQRAPSNCTWQAWMGSHITFEQCGSIDDLDKSIQCGREAVSLCSEGHSEHGAYLNNLAGSLWTRFNHQGNYYDLNEAISLYEEALCLCPVGHKYRDFALDNLGLALFTRFKQCSDVNDINRAISLQRCPAWFRNHAWTWLLGIPLKDKVW